MSKAKETKPKTASKDKTKNKIIAEELEKLSGIYDGLEDNTKKSVSSLVQEAAFMAASLYELRIIINKKGYTEEYQNGENQRGTKKCSEVEIYIQLSKNYMSIIKQLTDLLPKAKEISAENNDGFDNFVGDRGD